MPPEAADLRRLPLPPPEPYFGESLRGLIVRLAEQYSCQSAVMAKTLGLSGAVTPSRDDLTTMAARTEIDREALFKMGGVFGHDAMLVGQFVPADLLRNGDLRFCVECLRERAFHQQVWDLRILGACPVHGVALRSTCHVCGGKVEWTRRHLTLCGRHCGVDLREAEPDPVPENGVTAARLVYRKLGLHSEGAALPRQLAELPLSDLLALFGFFGRMELLLVRRDGEGLPGSRKAFEPRVFDVGAEIALEWPQGFEELAGRLRAVFTKGRNVWGAKARYLHLHRFVRGATGPLGDLLRPAYRHLLEADGIAHPLTAHDGGPLFAGSGPVGQIAAPPGYVKSSDLPALLGLTPEKYAKLRSHAWWTSLGKGRRVGAARCYDRAAVDALKERLSQRTTLKAASQALGIDPDRTRELIADGLLTTERVPTPISRGATLDSEEIAGLLAAIETRCAEHRVLDPGDLPWVLALMKRRPIRLSCFLRWMQDGTVPVAIGDPARPGLRRFVVDKSEASAICGEFPRDRSGPKNDGILSAAEFANTVGIYYVHVAPLVANGILRPSDEPRRERYVRFERVEADRFRATYVSLGKMARELNTRNDVVRAILAKLGVQACVEVERGGKRLSLYDAKRVDPNLVEREFAVQSSRRRMARS